jgi:glycosyltransferase involved in cell wall biosynthesis
LGVIPLKPGAAHIAVPSKTWNYLAAARPIVGCVEADSPLAKMIQESGAGSAVPPDDPAQLAQAILDFRNDSARARNAGRLGRDYVEANLSRRSAIRRYLQMFNRVLGHPDQRQ